MAPKEAAGGERPGRKLVKEIDVYVANDTFDKSANIVLLQYPLRPPWRPYNVHEARQLRVKPKANRIEIDVPAEEVATGQPRRALTLRSAQTHPEARLALGVLSDDALHLVPVDSVHLMRPRMDDLPQLEKQPQPGADGAAGDDAAQVKSEDQKPSVVTVHIRRRETDRQQELRRNSYAYMVQQEDEEAWTTADIAHPGSSTAAGTLRRLRERPTGAAVRSLGAAEYLDAIAARNTEQFDIRPADRVAPPDNEGVAGGHGAPRPSGAEDAKMDVDAVPPGGIKARARAAQAEAGRASARGAKERDDGLAALVREHARSLLERHHVLIMESIREGLRAAKDPRLTSAANSMSDEALHRAVTSAAGAAKPIMYLHKRYILPTTPASRSAGSPGPGAAYEKARAVVVSLLEQNTTVRRLEVFEALRATGMADLDEPVYHQVMRELCHSRGSQWSLRDGLPQELLRS